MKPTFTYHVWEPTQSGLKPERIVVVKYFALSKELSIITTRKLVHIIGSESIITINELAFEILNRLNFAEYFTFKQPGVEALPDSTKHEVSIETVTRRIVSSVEQLENPILFGGAGVGKTSAMIGDIAEKYARMHSGVDIGRGSGKSIVSLRDHTGARIGRAPISLPAMVDAPDMLEAYMESMRKAISEHTDEAILRSKK